MITTVNYKNVTPSTINWQTLICRKKSLQIVSRLEFNNGTYFHTMQFTLLVVQKVI